MAVYFADPSGDNSDGLTWATAYTTLQTAFDMAANDDTIYSDSTMASPFREDLTVSAKTGLTWITNAGANRGTVVSGTRVATQANWTDEGGGVFSTSVTLGDEADLSVAYNYQQDDTAGTVTGVDLTTTTIDGETIEDWFQEIGFNSDDLRAWYGFLMPGGATSTPAEGEFGYIGTTTGTLYVNPPGTPTIADVASNTEWTYGLVNGGHFTNCQNIKIVGRLIGYLFISDEGNDGYTVKADRCGGGSVEGVVSIGGGKHCVGFVGTLEKDSTIKRCLANCMRPEDAAGVMNPFVIASANNSSDLGSFDSTIQKLGFIAYPQLNTSGAPVYPTETATSQVFLAHSNVSGGDAEGLTVEDCRHADFIDMINTKHSSTLTASSTPAVLVNDFSGIDPSSGDNPLNASLWKIRGQRCKFYGRSGFPGRYVVWDSCVFDRSGSGDNDQVTYLTGSAVQIGIWCRSCLIATGNYGDDSGSKGFIRLDGNSALILEKCTVIVTNTNAVDTNLAIIKVGTTQDVCYLASNVFAKLSTGGDNVDALVRATSPTIWDDLFGAVHTDGRNVIDTEDFPNPVRHNNDATTPRDSAWWIANIVNYEVTGESDSFVSTVGFTDADNGDFSPIASGTIEGRKLFPGAPQWFDTPDPDGIVYDGNIGAYHKVV